LQLFLLVSLFFSLSVFFFVITNIGKCVFRENANGRYLFMCFFKATSLMDCNSRLGEVCIMHR
jgi:hypothetical protein